MYMTPINSLFIFSANKECCQFSENLYNNREIETFKLPFLTTFQMLQAFLDDIALLGLTPTEIIDQFTSYFILSS